MIDMPPNYITMGALIVLGIVIGLIFSPLGSAITVVILLLLGVAGLFAAVWQHQIAQESLLLLMAAGPVAGIVFVTAVVTSASLAEVKKKGGRRK